MKAHTTIVKDHKTQGWHFMGLIVCQCAMAIAAAGCSTTWKHVKNRDYKRVVGMKSDKPLPPEVPTRIVSTWTDTVLQQAGKTSQRGFGGRLMFFKNGSNDPVRVDGQLVIYAFDETDREPYETHPSRKFVFPREEFARHESECQLGPSYSVWLPWDEVGGTVKQISLIAFFEPHEGSVVRGEQTRHLLPGISRKDPEHLVQKSGVGPVEIAQHVERPKVENAVRQLSNETPVEEQKSEAKKPLTTTIALPKTWEKRLAK